MAILSTWGVCLFAPARWTSQRYEGGIQKLHRHCVVSDTFCFLSSSSHLWTLWVSTSTSLSTASWQERLTWSSAPTRTPWPPWARTSTTCVCPVRPIFFAIGIKLPLFVKKNVFMIWQVIFFKNKKSSTWVIFNCPCCPQSTATLSSFSTPQPSDPKRVRSGQIFLFTCRWKQNKNFLCFLGRGGYYGNSGGGSRSSGLRGSYWCHYLTSHVPQGPHFVTKLIFGCCTSFSFVAYLKNA